MTNNLLTVNVCTYNHKEWIGKCLDSILEQKTDFDFIVRIFDDASTDGTQDICRKYKEKYPDIIELYFAEKNLGFVNGVMQNPLRSYQNITTPYYLYIEGDDYRIDKDGFQIQVDALESHPECIACMADTVNFVEGVFQEDIHPYLETGIYQKKDIIEQPIRVYFANLGTRIVRTKYIDIIKGNENLWLCDTSQFYSLLDKGPFYFVKKTLFCYNQTNQGICTGIRLFDKISNSFTTLKNYLENSDKQIELQVAYFFLSDVAYFVNKEIKSQDNKESNGIIIFFKSIFHAILPGFVPVAIHTFRDWGRELRKNKNIGKALIKLILPGGIPMAIHYFRDLIRKRRRKIR